MKIKYDSSQPFQLQAISAITSVFDGQPDDADAFDAVLRSRSVYGDQIGFLMKLVQLVIIYCLMMMRY